MENLEDLFDSLRETLPSLLPVLMVALLLMVDMLFFATSVFPAWQNYSALTAELEASEAALAEREAAQAGDDSVSVLQAQIESMSSSLVEAAALFMTVEYGENILAQLYAYADASGVEVTNLQAQQAATGDEEDAAYYARSFRLQVIGTVPQLMNYVMRMQEARAPTVVVDGVNLVTDTEPLPTLTLNLTVYISPHASGDVLAALPTAAVPSPAPALTLTPDVVNSAAPVTAPTDASQAAAPPAAPTATPQQQSVPATEAPPASISGRVVNARQLNVRYGPGTEWPVFARLAEGEIVQVIGRNDVGTWGVLPNEGWVSLSYVELARPDLLMQLPIVEPPPPSQ